MSKVRTKQAITSLTCHPPAGHHETDVYVHITDCDALPRYAKPGRNFLAAVLMRPLDQLMSQNSFRLGSKHSCVFSRQTGGVGHQ